MQGDPGELRRLLKHYFGFAAFRPLQEGIICDALAGKDVLAVLPTGGGKSLCYQLPALVNPGAGVVVVVSPLIALMKDQVDALQAAGVAATFLNSSLAAGEAHQRLRGLHRGEFRLLYVAPERLMLSGFLEDLRRWNVRLFAIDEAHCISEWGHDFRPEYRRLAELRGLFPGVPMMGLTATATERVRHDIATQLNLRDPACYVASFNRPNLTYRVAAKAGAYERVRKFVRARRGESGIIYCQARKTTEALAAKLKADGIQAAPYHAGLSADVRTRHQEAFQRDQVSVICATIAFGMGIDKPNVRFVVHYDLPKNVEGYYQETGRAGRDGLPGECLLLFSHGDRVKHLRFIDEKPDPKEREIARAQLEQVLRYAQCPTCRRAFLLGYFGEVLAPANCAACDNCLAPAADWDATVAVQKFLSCVYRIREMSRCDVGIPHIVEVLRGAETPRIHQWGHQALSTYGIGAEHAGAEWLNIGRQLVRQGLLRLNLDAFDSAELTDLGLTALKLRRKVMLTHPTEPQESPPQEPSELAPAPKIVVPRKRRKQPPGAITCDEALFERLRQLRRKLADQRGVPAYIVFSDVSLRQMAGACPQNEAAFSRISGVGAKKLHEFGPTFMGEIAAYRRAHALKSL